MNRTVHEGQYVIIDVQKSDGYYDYTRETPEGKIKVWRVNMKFTVQCNGKLRRHTTSFEIMRLDDMKKIGDGSDRFIEGYKKNSSGKVYAVHNYDEIYDPLGMLVSLGYDELIDGKTGNYRYDVQMMKEIETAIESFIELELDEAANPMIMTNETVKNVEKDAGDMK